MPFLAEDSDGEDGHAAAHDHDHDAESLTSSDSASGAVVHYDHSGLELNAQSDSNGDRSQSSFDTNGDRSQAPSHTNDGRLPSSPESEDNGSQSSSHTNGGRPQSSSMPDDDSSEPSSEADNNRGRHRPARFFDLEAEDDQDSDMEEDYDNDDDDDDDRDIVEFPQFSRFPPELRRMIWEAYCPDLTSRQGRVYDIFSPTRHLEQNVTLPQRTHEARTVLAVNQESRNWALKAFPDELALPSAPSNVLRFDKHKDIVIFNHPSEPHFRASILQQVHNLAVGAQFYASLEDMPQPGSSEMPNLEQIFFIVNARECRVQDTLRWCAAKPTIVSSPVTFVEEIDGRESTHLYQYCWPDVKKWPGFTGHEVEISVLWGIGEVPFPRAFSAPGGPLANATAADDESDDDSQFDADERAHRIRIMVRDHLAQVPIYPLVEFQDREFLGNILSWNGDPEDWDPGWDDENGYFWRNDDDLNTIAEEYDSSGIDDSEIEELSQGDEDEDDLDLDLDDVDESDHLGFDGESEEVSGDELPLPSAPAHFSSPESATVRGDSSSADRDQGEESRPHGQSGNQTVITIDDESNDDSDEEAPRKRKRATSGFDDSSSSSNGEGPMRRSRKRRVISDDSDSADSVPHKRVRRSRIVADSGDSDAEDDEMVETSDDVQPAKKQHAGRRTNPIELSESESASGSDDSSPSGSEEDDDAPPSKPMSLAERLALNRHENPIPISDSEDGEENDSSIQEEEGDEEDHDGGAVGEYAYGGRFPDDDEGNDDSSAQEEAQEGEIFDEESDEGY
ncbi:hypothetical protein B0T18DRAFT_420471 [Schizothecium vesticola]|uniref:2EXR domain-containing protein n=1 Tax=Schizothecium vesticola TaxID=314040 RepID=A0AA40BP94_9PEZI|nr:hypothetical protein B0T18DRAFT_420471 [Schizothecium vesticola]